jgi:hypothetical protein
VEEGEEAEQKEKDNMKKNVAPSNGLVHAPLPKTSRSLTFSVVVKKAPNPFPHFTRGLNLSPSLICVETDLLKLTLSPL